MPIQDKVCVHVAGSMGDAVVTAACLSSRGIPARVMDAMTLGGLEGIVSIAGSISSRGIQVWIEDPSQLEEAREVLREHLANQTQRTAQRDAGGPIEMACDKCGKQLKFSAAQRGTVEECPRCGNYMDVGEVEDNLEWESDDGEDKEPGDVDANKGL